MYLIESKELLTFLSSMLPFTELRGSIPLGILKFNLPPQTVYILSVIGNIIPVIFLQIILPHLINILSKIHPKLEALAHKYYEKTHTNHAHKIQKYGAIFLIAFVAIPLPGSGAYSGSILAYLCGYSKKQATILITLGILIAGILVTTATQQISQAL